MPTERSPRRRAKRAESRPLGSSRLAERASGEVARPKLRMRDLERATRVGRETIRFYIREGLLPEPERPRRNVAWYDASFVERVRLIKELQGKRYLPLHVIKAILDGDRRPPPAEVGTLLRLDGKLPQSVRLDSDRPPEKVSEVARRTGLSTAEIRRLAKLEVVEIATRRGVQGLEPRDVRLVELWAELRRSGYVDELGFVPENLRLYVDAVRWLAREELRLFTRGVTGKVGEEETAAMAERGIEVVNEIIGLLRRSTLLRFIAEGNLPAGREREMPEVVG